MKKNPKGYVCFVLHAHLPFVHHPENDTYLEEQWLFEAISETYIPLLLMFEKLQKENVDFIYYTQNDASLFTTTITSLVCLCNKSLI